MEDGWERRTRTFKFFYEHPHSSCELHSNKHQTIEKSHDKLLYLQISSRRRCCRCCLIINYLSSRHYKKLTTTPPHKLSGVFGPASKEKPKLVFVKISRSDEPHSLSNPYDSFLIPLQGYMITKKRRLSLSGISIFRKPYPESKR